MEHAEDTATYDVTCPHCRRSFSAPLIRGAAARYEGFKCPHCRLFVPFTRTDEPTAAQ